MKISDERSIQEIQTEFSELYPGLKIEFYSEVHEVHKNSPSDLLLESSNLIGDIRDIHGTKEWKIEPTHSVAEVESTLKDTFGLNAQVFRKSKDIWLQTSATDDWTIEKQNLKGLHSMRPNSNLYNN